MGGAGSKRALAVALVVTAFAIAGCGGAESRYLSHMERGKQYLAQGRLDKAGIEFRNSLQIRPKAAEALFLSGQVAERRGDMRNAAGFYNAALEVQPELDRARAALGSIYVAGGAPERAIKLVEPILAKRPDTAALLVIRAAARGELKQTAGARQDAQQALRLDPSNEQAVGLLAGLDRVSGDTAGAIALVSAALARRPDSTDLRELLVAVYLEDKRTEDAARELRKLIETRPQEFRFRYQLALALSRDHQTDAARRTLEDAVKAIPDSNYAKLTLVDFLFAQVSRAEGERALRDFISRNPKNSELGLDFAQLLAERGSAQQALNVYADVIRVEGARSYGLLARDGMAAIELSQGQDASAQKLIDEVLEKSPHDDQALALRGRIEAQHNNPVAAIADLRAALRDQPGAVALRRVLAQAYVANHDLALAEEALRTATQMAPADTAIRVELAEVMMQNDHLDQAVALLEQTVRDVPADVSVREALTRAYLVKPDLAAARRAAEDLKTLRPQSPRSYYLSGVVARADKRPDDAQRDLEHALVLQPNALDVLTELTRLELTRDQADKALAQLRSAAVADPRSAGLQNLLGEVYIARKDQSHAEAALSQAIALAPHWSLPYRNLARMRAAANDLDGAVREYQSALKAAPDDPQVGIELSAAYAKEARIDDAISSLDAVCRRNPQLQQAANNLAMLLVNYRTDPESLDRARDLSASFASSNDGVLLDTNGWVRYKRGQYGEALGVLERAAQLIPASPEIRYHVAMAELHAGQRDRARTNLQFALAGSAKFVGANDARSALASL